jgi:hypothetical protein
MCTIPVHFYEVIRFYERINKIKPAAQSDRGQSNNSDFLNISAEAKKRLVREQAGNEVLEKIRK